MGGVLAVGACVRFGALGADLPIEPGLSYAPVQDAAWYVETAARQVEGVAGEPQPSPWDVGVWTSVARAWFEVWGAGPRAAHALGATLSLATVLALWRFLRPLGGRVALASACALALLYPTVLLGRSALVYGPAALYLLSCAALWRLGHGQPARRRVLCEVLAWVAVLLGCWSLRPPLAALAGGLFAGHVVRSKHPKRWLLAGAGLVGLGALAVAALPVLRAFPAVDQFAYRLSLHGFRLDPLALAGGMLQAAGEPNSGGSGFARLALVPLLAALWGWVVVVQQGSNPRVNRKLAGVHSRETLALLVGWVAGFYLANLPFSSRPLRYWALVGPPLAGLIGIAWAVPLRPRALSRWEVVAITVPGAAVGAHATGVLVEQLWASALPPAGLVAGALAGAAAPCLLATSPEPARWRRLGVVLAICAMALPCARLVLRPTWWTLRARHALPELVADDAILCGPYAPVLSQGTGRARRLHYQLRTDLGDDYLLAGLALAQDKGLTHVALGLDQERHAQLRHHCARLGYPLEVVGLLYVGGPPDHDRRRRLIQGDHVLLLRFPWASKSPVERGRPPREASAWVAFGAGLCARGEPSRANRLLLAAPPEAHAELQSAIRRTAPLPTVR